MEQKGNLMFAVINSLDEIRGNNPISNHVSVVPFLDIPIRGLKKFSNHLPGRLWIADWNNDGYPDLVTTIEHLNGTDQAVVLLNQPCREANLNDTCNWWEFI